MALGQDAVPEQHDRRPDRELAVEAHGERVHRDRPDDLARLAADAHFGSGQVAPEAVAVADGHDADPGRRLGYESPAVPGALARLELLDLCKERLPRQHRLEAVVHGVGVERRQPVDRNATADKVEMRVRQAQRRRAVRGVARQVRVRARHRVEPLELRPGEVRIGIGSREVRHQPDHVCGRRRQLGQAVAVHARLELQVHANAVGNLLVRDGKLERSVARMRDLAARARRPEHEDALDAELVAQREPLRDRRDAQPARTGSERRAGRVHHPVSVAVRLDDGPQLRAVGRAQERADVAPQCAEVDGDLGAVHYASTSGSASMRSEAMSPRSGPSSAERP